MSSADQANYDDARLQEGRFCEQRPGCEQAACTFSGKVYSDDLEPPNAAPLSSALLPCSILLPLGLRNNLGRAEGSTSILLTLPFIYAYLIIRPPNGRYWVEQPRLTAGCLNVGIHHLPNLQSLQFSPILPSSLLFPFVLPTPYSSFCQLFLQSAFIQPLLLTFLIPYLLEPLDKPKPLHVASPPPSQTFFLHPRELLSIFYISLSAWTRQQSSCLWTTQPTSATEVGG